MSGQAPLYRIQFMNNGKTISFMCVKLCKAICLVFSKSPILF